MRDAVLRDRVREHVRRHARGVHALLEEELLEERAERVRVVPRLAREAEAEVVRLLLEVA